MQLSGQGQPVIGTAHLQSRSVRRLWCNLFLLLSLSLLGAEPPAPSEADSPAVRLANEFVQALEEKTRFKAESEFLETESKHLKADRSGKDGVLLENLATLRPEIRTEVLNALEDNAEHVQDDLEKLTAESQARIEKLRESCISTRAELNSGQILLFEVTAQNKFIGQFASLINVDNRYLWLCGVLAVGALLLVRAHHYRHYYRRLSWVRRSRMTLVILGFVGCLCLVLVPTLLTFLLGNRTYDSLISLTQAGEGTPKSRLEKEVAQLQSVVADARALNATMLQKRDEALAKRKKRVDAVLSSAAQAKVPIQEMSQGIRDQIRELTVQAQIEEALSKELGLEIPKLKGLQVELATNAKGIRNSLLIKKLTGAGLGLLLLGCSIWAGLHLERRITRERKKLSNTCPRCLAKGKLQPNPNQQASGGIVPVAIRELVCTNIISEDPYEECEFTFLEQHRERERLTFPTLGVASSGKTVGMLMTYHQLRNGKCYGTGTFEKLSTAGSREFDQKVDDLISNGIVPERTLIGALPPPVVFNFSDNDPLGKSNALINIFDYSGEITSIRMLTDAHRYRALNGDGYFFYLDPTYPSQDQSDALNRFREDIKTLRVLGPNEQVHTPVALCLSKIDLMVTMPYGQGDTILDFYEELRKIEQTTENGSLERIVKRSELVSRLRHLIWPDWEIEAQIRGLFGDRFMFFPMTPIGMDQPGEKNLAQRDLRPYCILEPLSWLLHMNGFPILKE